MYTFLMNKELLLIDLGEASSHLHQLVLEIARNKEISDVKLEIDLQHILKHIARGYNYRNAKTEEYLVGDLSQKEKLPPELLSDDTWKS